MNVDRVSVIVADPPWQFGDDLPGKGRGASRHYAVMPTREIERFLIDHPELPRITTPALLFLWRVGAMQEEAFRVARAWGFEVKSELVWIKTTAGAAGGRAFGMGRYTRWCHETCLIAARGSGASLIRDHAVRSVFDAPIGAHSAKPDAFYSLVEKMTDGPWLELFARRARAGWVQHGNELPGAA